jgi:hypothetical protein
VAQAEHGGTRVGVERPASARGGRVRWPARRVATLERTEMPSVPGGARVAHEHDEAVEVDTERARREWEMAAFTAALAGCSAVSPPPVVALHEAVTQSAPGGVSVAAMGGAADGVFLAPAAGGQVTVAYQASEAVALEAAGGAGTRTDPANARGGSALGMLGFGRAGARYRSPTRDWLTLRAGLGGGGGDTGLRYATADLGASFGWTLRRRLRVYLGSVAALSGRVSPDGLNTVTLWVGGNVGASVRILGALELGAEGTVLGGFEVDGYAEASVFSLLGSVRYTFGATR